MISTRIIRLDPISPDPKLVKEAADTLKNGCLVIIPTETVYGIAADAANKKALQRLYEIKKRPQSKPFALLLSDLTEAERFAKEISLPAYKLMHKFWPGPLTMVLKSKDGIGNIGLRLPDNEIALRVISLAGVSASCPSANVSGKAAAINFAEAIKDMQGLVDLAIDAGPTRLGVESSVVDLTGEPLRILREAAIKKAEIEAVAGRKNVLFICTGNSCRSVMAEALLKKILKEKNRTDVEVSSAGIMLLGGLGASEATKEVLKREGIDVSAHASQRASKNLIRKSDIILVMEKMHEERILSLTPEVKNRLFLLKEFAKINDNSLDIADPIDQPLEFYEKAFAVIKEAVEKVSNII